MDWLKTLGQIAPTIASVLGGPFAGLAVSFAGKALGMSDTTVQSVKDAISKGQMTGDQILALKQAEIEFKQHLADKDLTLEQLSVSNTNSARDMQKTTRSKIPAILAIVVTMGFFGILGYMLKYPAAATSQPLLIMLGSLGTAWVAIINFYFGSSHGSQMKDDKIAALQSLKS